MSRNIFQLQLNSISRGAFTFIRNLSLALDLLRSKALFQNTIDVWIMFCDERGIDWYDINAYRSFVSYLKSNRFKMQKFPLCIKESAGVYERGKDKVKFLEDLSHISTDDAGAFTIKLADNTMATIRKFRT
jgi:hypothetical protein